MLIRHSPSNICLNGRKKAQCQEVCSFLCSDSQCLSWGECHDFQTPNKDFDTDQWMCKNVMGKELVQRVFLYCGSCCLKSRREAQIRVKNQMIFGMGDQIGKILKKSKELAVAQNMVSRINKYPGELKIKTINRVGPCQQKQALNQKLRHSILLKQYMCKQTAIFLEKKVQNINIFKCIKNKN